MKFQKDLVSGFFEEQREIAMEENKDPYRVEFRNNAADKQRVDTVIPFNRFIEWFPTLGGLCQCR